MGWQRRWASADARPHGGKAIGAGAGRPGLRPERGEKARRGIWLDRRVACLGLLARAVGAGRGGEQAAQENKRSGAVLTGVLGRCQEKRSGLWVRVGQKTERMRGREEIRSLFFSFKHFQTHFQIFLN